MGVQISPSILSADFTDLAREVARVAPRADWVHVDVMDNHFVPNLTLGLPVVRRLAAVSDLPLDVHLMIEDADRWAPDYAESGARSVTFHVEASAAPVRLARTLRGLGVRAGMALRPATPVEPYAEMLPELDMLLLMTVEPGFGGQSFMADMMGKSYDDPDWDKLLDQLTVDEMSQLVQIGGFSTMAWAPKRFRRRNTSSAGRPAAASTSSCAASSCAASEVPSAVATKASFSAMRRARMESGASAMPDSKGNHSCDQRAASTGLP